MLKDKMIRRQDTESSSEKKIEKKPEKKVKLSAPEEEKISFTDIKRWLPICL